MTPQLRLQTYSDVPLVIQELYSSEATIEVNKQMKEKYQLSSAQYNTYLDVTGDTILGFHHTKDLPQLLQKEVGLSADEAQRVVADLAEFLSPVLEREEATANQKRHDLQSMSKQFASSAPTTASPVTTPPTETTQPKDGALEERSLTPQSLDVATNTHNDTAEETPSEQAPTGDVHDVLPMRTMKGDMKRIHGYGAYRQEYPADNTADTDEVYRSEQTDTLKREPLVEMPKVEGE